MKSLRAILPILSLFFLVGCLPDEPLPTAVVESCQPMPDVRTSATCFMWGDTCYVWGGRNLQSACNADLWCYLPAENRWTAHRDTPLKGRVRAVAIVHGDDVYLGLGANGRYHIDSTYLADWWRFRPAAGEWTHLADYPAQTTVGAVAWADEENIYVGYGNHGNFDRDVYRYNLASDTWQQIFDPTAHKSTHPPRAHSVTGTDCAGRHFVGTGYYINSVRFWAEMCLHGDSLTWEMRASVPGKGRSNACSVATSDAIFLAGGQHVGGTVTDGYYFEDILRYDLASDRWTRFALLPDGGQENMIAFRHGDYLYFGLGNDSYNRPLDRLYRIHL